jgi:two-component system, response regulator PdtaR
LTKTSILVVEDDGIIALYNHELLTKKGFAVPQMFASGEDLLDYLFCSAPPDLILMDIGLHGNMDGIETARRVRQKWNVPIIFLTSYSDDKRIAQAQEISPHGYIIKPIVESQLMNLIGAALGSTGPSPDRV